MPRRALKLCGHPGCGTLVESGFCTPHKKKSISDPKRVRERQAARALPTYSARWKRLRRRQLAANPLCEICLEKGRVTSASHVDHINGDAFNNSHDNLQSLCPSCHSRKTAAEDGGFGNRKAGESGEGGANR